MNNKQIVFVGLVFLAIGLLASSSCSEPEQPRARRTGRSSAASQNDSAVLIETVVNTLNNLPDESVLNLIPPEPILDDAKSADGKPVLATLNVNPKDPEGGFNYLSVPAGNANFRGVGVKQGDIVRYFVNYDPESAEHGGGDQVGYFEIPVRRLDSDYPNNAIILDGSLNGSVEIPHRIEIWRFSDRRVNEIRLRLRNYVRRRQPAIAWEPSPDETALVQLLDRVNQWLRNLSDDRASWKKGDLIDTLPKDLQEDETISQSISADNLREGQFDLAQVRSLQEAIWHRDISTWAKGTAYEKLEVATHLFDWTIRNIQLDDSEQPGIVHQPWQALMYGHGTAELRAWVFAELCRQQQIDVAVLTFGEAGQGSEKQLAAVLAGDQLHLFDTRLGLPFPGPDGNTPATLTEIIANPELLRKLDLEGEGQYPLDAEDLKDVRAFVIATPLQLSRKAALLQGVMQGENFVVLTAQADSLADSLRKMPALKSVELWTFPFTSRIAELSMRRLQREAAAQRFLVFSQKPKLWKARVLHFQGTKPVPVSQQNDPLAQPRHGHREATALYQSSDIRPPDDLLEQLEPLARVVPATAKSDASYWLGLLSYDLGKYEVAEDWLRRRTLESFPKGPWTNGAKYNLARTLMKLGKPKETIALLEADDSPQRHGNLLLARKLQETEEVAAVNQE